MLLLLLLVSLLQLVFDACWEVIKGIILVLTVVAVVVVIVASFVDCILLLSNRR